MTEKLNFAIIGELNGRKWSAKIADGELECMAALIRAKTILFNIQYDVNWAAEELAAAKKGAKKNDDRVARAEDLKAKCDKRFVNSFKKAAELKLRLQGYLKSSPAKSEDQIKDELLEEVKAGAEAVKQDANYWATMCARSGQSKVLRS